MSILAQNAITNLYFFWDMGFTPPFLKNVKKLHIWKRGTSFMAKAWGTISPGECSQGRWLRVCQTCVQGSHSFSIKHTSRRGSLFFQDLGWQSCRYAITLVRQHNTWLVELGLTQKSMLEVVEALQDKGWYLDSHVLWFQLRRVHFKEYTSDSLSVVP